MSKKAQIKYVGEDTFMSGNIEQELAKKSYIFLEGQYSLLSCYQKIVEAKLYRRMKLIQSFT